MSRRAGKALGQDVVLNALQDAPPADLPGSFAPQLATLATGVPAAGDWGYEIKFDGYRLLVRIEGGRCRLFTRAGNDWTDRMPSLADALGALGIDDAWLDGEAVVMDAQGLPSFNALQNAFDGKRTESIQLFLFDAPRAQGSPA